MSASKQPYLVIKVSIEAQDVGMSEMTLYFNFTSKLMHNLGLLQLALEEYFQSNNMITLYQNHILVSQLN